MVEFRFNYRLQTWWAPERERAGERANVARRATNEARKQ